MKQPAAPAHDQATLDFYAAEAPVYTASGPGGISRHLDGFLELLPPGASVLELGCGGGRDSEAMLARGFDVEPSDGVAEIAAQAEARLRKPVRVLRFDELDAIERYDAVWAHASLLHVPRPALPGVLTRIFRALRSGGHHFASFKGGGTEGRDRLGRYFNYLDMDEAIEAYRRSAPWEIVAISEGVGGGYDGGQGPWVTITVRKPA
jgi:SAM-dependent methyltransferase